MEADVKQLTTVVKHLIQVVKSIAAEQATVDRSGSAWGSDTANGYTPYYTPANLRWRSWRKAWVLTHSLTTAKSTVF